MGLFSLFKKHKQQTTPQKTDTNNTNAQKTSTDNTIPQKNSTGDTIPHKTEVCETVLVSTPAKPSTLNSPDLFVDSNSISPDERPYYQPDNYYTYYSHPGTEFAHKVTPFEERKQISYPSSRGLYVAEIMLLEYCNQGNYPKPPSGYPGFWWFKYGIRDVGHALESLEERGFIKWRPKAESLQGLKVDELKAILSERNLSVTGKKADLIDRIITQIPENELSIPNYTPRYELTEIGKIELTDNAYVPYMHNHPHLTIEDSKFGKPFTVWEINKLFPDGNAQNWREVVGEIEKRRFGVNMTSTPIDNNPKTRYKTKDCSAQKNEIKEYLLAKKATIDNGIKTKGDGFEEESKGLDYKAIGKDKEALVMFYIAIGKKFDAPALYRETAILLRKYGLLDEELSVINAGLKNIPNGNRHKNELAERKKKVQELLKKQA